MNSFENFAGKPLRSLKKKRSKWEKIQKTSLDYEKGSVGKGQLLQNFLNLKLSKSERLLALFNLWHEYFPVSAEDRENRYDLEKFPVNPEKYKLSQTRAAGGENDVYFLTTAEESSPAWAVKVNHHVKDNDRGLLKAAQKMKRDFKEIKESLPLEMAEIVPDEQTMIIKDPVYSGNAIVTWQKFLGTDLRDVFKDIDKPELVRLLTVNPRLYNELNAFQKTMINKERDTKKVFDIFGDKNLSIVKASAERLVFLDPRYCCKGDGSYLSLEKSDDIRDRYYERMRYLDEVLGEAKHIIDQPGPDWHDRRLYPDERKETGAQIGGYA